MIHSNEHSSLFHSRPNQEIDYEQSFFTFRIKPNNFVTIESYNAPGLRNKFYRFLARLLKQ